MKKALLVSLMLFFSMFAPFDFSGLNFNFAYAEEATSKNSPPVAVNDFYKTEMNKQLTIAAPGVLENDSDPDGNMLLSAKLSDPANGMVVMGTDGRFIYVPKTDLTGTDSFTYTVYDGVDASSTATVTINVGQAAEPQVQKKEETTTPKNSPPVAVDDYYITAVDTQLALIAPGIISNDNDPDGDFLLVAVSKGPSKGSLSLGTDGGFTYMPNAGFSGIDSFTYSLHDGKEGSSTALVTITVASAQETQQIPQESNGSKDNNSNVASLDDIVKKEANFSIENIGKDVNLSKKDVNESVEKLPEIKTFAMSSVGTSTYFPWQDAGIKPYGQYFVNNTEYVNPKTGQLIIRSTDLSVPARGLDLVITRVYQSPLAFNCGDPREEPYTFTNFGNGTKLDYPWIGGNYLYLEGGQQYYIEWTSNTFEYHKGGVHFILTKNGDNTYTLKRPNGLKYQFDTSKKLTRIEDTNGNYLLFTYNGSNMIDKIKDTLGREAVFTYTNGKVSSISFEDKEIQYTYDGSKLVTITDPLGRETQYEYSSAYENSDWLITKVIYPTGGFTEYTFDETTEGVKELIDHTTDGSQPSLSLDANNSPHIAYYDMTNQDLIYVKWDGSKWTKTVVDSDYSYYRGQYPELDTDSQNRPHILYYGQQGVEGYGQPATCEYYTYYNGTSWSKTSIDGGLFWQYYGHSIKTSGTTVHMAWQNGSQYATHIYAYYMQYGSGSELIGGRVSYHPSLDIRGTKKTIVYQNRSETMPYSYSFIVAENTGGGWSQRVLLNENVNRARVAIDSNNYNHITYNLSGLKYIRDTGGTPSPESVDGNSSGYMDIAVDTSDNPHIAYNTYDNVKYAVKRNGSWNVSTIDDLRNSGASIDIDSEGNPHIVYFGPYFTHYYRGKVYRVSSQKIYESVGNLSSENTFNYTVSDNKVIQEVTTTKDGSGNTKSTTTLVIDDEDRTTTSKTVKDASAVQLYKVEYAYNSNLETTQESVYRGNTASVTYTKKYNYDNWGNLVYYEDPMPTPNKYYYSFVNTNYENSFRDFSGSTVSGFSNSFYTENSVVSEDIHSLLCGKAFDNSGIKIESYYKYDSKGNLTNSKSKHNSGWIYVANSYDSHGNITSTTDPLSHVINFEYDNDYNYAYLTRTYASVGGINHQTTYDYNFATGDIISQTDGEGNTTYYTYDTLGRITELEYPDTKTKRAVYDDVNNIVTTYDEKNHYAKQYFDGLGRKEKAETYMNSSLYQTTTSTYNYLGLVSSTTDPLNRTTSFTYDALGRITSTTLPDGNSSSREYNDIANTLLVTYENGNTKKLFYDNLGRLVKLEEYPESGTTYSTNYYYDGLSTLTQKVLQNGYTETYVYDDLGRLTRTNYPDSTYEEITYDDAGNIISTRDRKANVVTFTYDELNRLIRKSNSDSTSVKYTYDKRSLLTKEEANFSAVSESGGGGGGSPLIEANISTADRPYKFFGTLAAGKELVSMRTETSKTFDNGDGTYTSVFHAKPIHFKNESNDWEEIDARIRVNKGQYKIGKNKFDVSFGNNSLYSISNGHSSISFTPTKVRINDETISIDNAKMDWKLIDDYHMEGEIADGIYLWMQSHEAFVRHAIKTDKKIKDFEAVYLVSILGYTKEKYKGESKDGKNYYLPDENGNIYFKDSAGNIINIPQPIMWNDENSSNAINHELWEQDGKLYYRKYSTEEGNLWLSKQSGTLYLDSSTYYGELSDIYLYSPTLSSFSDARSYPAGYNGSSTTNLIARMYYYTDLYNPFTHFVIYRGFCFFDTSSIPDDATITAASLNLRTASTYSSGGTAVVVAMKSTSSVPTDMYTYSAFTGNAYGDTGTLSPYTWATITLNSQGKSDISKTGLTKYCLREKNHDYDNVGPSSPCSIGGKFYASDYSGTSYDPRLVVSYNQLHGKSTITSVDGTIKPPEGKGYNASDPDGNNLTHRWRVKDDSNNTIFNSGWFDNPNDINGTEFTGLSLGNTYNAYLESNDSEFVISSDPYPFKYTGKLPSKSTITSIGGQQANNSYVTQNPPLAYGYNSSDLDGDNLKHRWRFVKGGSMVPEGFETEKYKRPITISNSGTNLTNYQIKINLTSSNFDFTKSTSNGADIRFSDDDNATSLSYWIEKWDSQNQQATIWIKVPAIPNGSSTVFIYYGSETMQNASSGTNTFLFFDDFSGSTLNSSKWSIDTVGTIDETVNNEITLTGGRTSGGDYWIYNTTDTGNQHRAKVNGSQFAVPSKCTIEWKGKAISGDMAQAGVGLIKSSDNTVRAYLAISDGSGGNGCVPSLWGYVEATTGSGTITVGQYKDFKLIKNDTTITGYQKDTTSESWTQIVTGTSSNIDRMAITQGTYGGYTYEQMALDNIKVREYASAEPTITVGSQKSLDVLINYFDSGWFDNPNDINGTEINGLSLNNTYKSYLDVNDSVNVVSSDPFIFTLESSQPEFNAPYDTSITYTYDSRGRLTSETSDINGSTYTTSYSYDDASNITSITYPSTNSYSYTYDDVNRITALTGYAGFTYTDTNMIHTIAYENDITTTYTYDVRDRPTGIAIGGLETLNYTYDPSGNVLSMNDWEYEYDGLNRLEAATSVFELDYTYDALGNRTQQTENTVTTSYTFNSMMRLTSKTVAGQATDFTYDLNGNLTEKEEGNSSYTYTWDINNRLREVRDDGNLLFEYLYDSHGRRVKSHNHSTGITTTYIYAGINVIHEVTSSESTDYLYANGMRIAKKTGATVKYFHSDHLGSTRLVTDSSGQPTFESDYKPFGEDANATGTEKYTFTGQYSEADIGLYYFGARWYDASLGRFISEDPINGSMTSSQSQNPYVYCMNNPLRYIDPTGMMLTDDPGHVDGYLQTYYGGEYHYYSAMDGSCNVSGDGYNYNDAVSLRKDFEEEYNRLYGPKQTEPSTTKSEKTNSIYKYDPWTGLRIGSSIPGMNVDISRNPVKQAYDPFVGASLTGLPLWWWTEGIYYNQMIGGAQHIVSGSTMFVGASLGVGAGVLSTAVGAKGVSAAVWAGSIGLGTLGVNEAFYGYLGFEEGYKGLTGDYFAPNVRYVVESNYPFWWGF